METLEVLERIPAIARALQRPGSEPAPALLRPAGEWKLHARERGRTDRRTVRLANYGQCRAMAIELSDIGFVVLVCDPKDCPRLQLWPPRLDD